MKTKVAFSFAFTNLLWYSVNAYTFREADDILCGAGDPCWPTERKWNEFNQTTGGKVFSVKPLATPCHGKDFNNATCNELIENWSVGAYTAQFIGGYPAHAYSDGFGNDSCRVDTGKDGPCSQGRVPPKVLRATSAKDIQVGLLFATAHKLRTRIKSTGHSLTGGATAFGAFGIDVHNMNKIQFVKNFKLSGTSITKGNAVIVGPGVQFFDLFAAADKAKRVVIGGGCDSVAVTGYTLGGGHSRYSPHLGLAVDNVFEVEIVTVDGVVHRANEKVNTELFYAVRGGGASFGVVTEWVFKTYPPVKNEAINNFQIIAPTAELYEEAMYQWYSLQPNLRAAGWSDLAIAQKAANLIIGAAFKPNHSDFATEALVYKPLADWATANGVTFVTNFTSYESQYALTIAEPFATQHVVDFDLLAYNSRLIPKTTFTEAKLRPIIKFFASLPSINFLNVPGGAVANSHADNMALNPAWRTALSHVIWETRWEKESTKEQQAAAREAGINQLNQLTELLDGSVAAYINESAADDDAWPQNYWGSNYARVLALKKKYDPTHFLTCNACVGSDIPAGRW